MSSSEKPVPQSAAPADAKPVPTLPPDMLIILPVRNMVLFPGVVLPVAIKRDKTVAGAQEAVRTDAKVASCCRRSRTRGSPADDLSVSDRSLDRALPHGARQHAHHLYARASVASACSTRSADFRFSSRGSSSCPTRAPPIPTSRRARSI
jgi:hypothetical protein